VRARGLQPERPTGAGPVLPPGGTGTNNLGMHRTHFTRFLSAAPPMRQYSRTQKSAEGCTQTSGLTTDDRIREEPARPTSVHSVQSVVKTSGWGVRKGTVSKWESANQDYSRVTPQRVAIFFDKPLKTGC
jgi:hypothetical protein